jgi:Mg2+-importing ATPase
MRTTLVLATGIFLANVFLHRPLVESFLFSVALAVGLTPQHLPAIVSVSLSAGAQRMARQHVIVKRLDAIEDFSSMTVLCTDKTGTLTAGSVSLAAALDAAGTPSEQAWRFAWLNASLQRAYANPLDDAILHGRSFDTTNVERVSEVPYDFSRKRLSVLVRDAGESLLISKGALEPILAVSTRVAWPTGTVALEMHRAEISGQFERLSAERFRVLGVATRTLPATQCSAADERDMTFVGFLVFSDAPKAGAGEAIAELAHLGISVRMITGDNPLAAAHAAAAVGLDNSHILTGSDLAALDDSQLAEAAAGTTIFAGVEPAQKARIVQALRARGEAVGFLGDGINDALALHQADVGISVDTTVFVAKQSAAIVLLDKELAVVAERVGLGRQTFANTLKYIDVNTSASFGNMLSMAVGSAFLPFLPLLPSQILLLNFLSDIPAMTLAGDAVDDEQAARPQPWKVPAIRTFMLIFGPISSLFDVITFGTLRRVFDAGPALFRSGWFVASVMTELAVMLVLRTRRPFFQSRPGRGLLVSSAAIAAVTLALPIPLLLATAAIMTGYVVVTEIAKRSRFVRG